MDQEFLTQLINEHTTCNSCPSPKEVSKFYQRLLGVFYLDFAEKDLSTTVAIKNEITILKDEFENLLLRNPANAILGTDKTCQDFFSQLPIIYELLNKDILAIYEGDPACKGRREVIRTYPGFYAIAAYRIAHTMVALNIEDLPRIITEHAHSLTGVDIRPPAISPRAIHCHNWKIILYRSWNGYCNW